jgi:CubicO group peptidase (beta-lactamase class C family)
MTHIRIEVEPAQVGLDDARLARIDAHFRRYVDDGRLPGWLLLVSRGGKVAHLSCYGHRDREAGLPVEPDTLFRIYSMTKPITSVAAMMLYEEGAFELKDPLKWYLPAFGTTRVFRGGSSMKPVTEPVTEPMRIWHLLTHTAGLTYGFNHVHPVDAMYRTAGFELGVPRGVDLAEACERWAQLPLVFQPGSRWNYSVATDVLGRLVEVISGTTLERFLAERILGPLGMTDTGFFVEEARRDRLAELYIPGPDRSCLAAGALGRVAGSTPEMLSGGGGLISTAGDYHRFCRMLLGRGELEGVRLLGPRTHAYMVRNHLPGGVDLEAFGQSTFAETTFDGVGFGLGFSVVQDGAATKVVGNEGEYGWGGAASTAFWVDPVDDLVVIFMTQLLPSSTYAIRSQLRQLVQQAVID